MYKLMGKKIFTILRQKICLSESLYLQCTKTCGGGEQFRLIQCVNTTSQQFAVGCDIDRKPEEKQDCNLDACPEHKAGN